MKKMWGKYAAVTATLAVTAILSVNSLAAAEKPVRSVVGEIETIFNGGFSPKVLSKTKPTPITFNISGQIKG